MSIPQTYIPEFHGEFNTHPWLSKLKFRPLGKTGLSLSQIGYGGAALANFYGNVQKDQAIEAIQSSLRAGINFIDTAKWYGSSSSESILGEALKEIPRGAYYIGTKCGRNYTSDWEGRFDFSGPAVLKNVENSLENLGLPYVDIIHIHDVEFCQDQKQLINETIPALESVVRAGKARFIGITGYDLEVLRQITKETKLVDVILSYSRMNLHDTSLLDYIPNFRGKGLGIINASPVAMGLLSSAGPPSWHPASKKVKECSTKASKYCDEVLGIPLEKVSVGFSLRPEPEMDNGAIATTLVSIPTLEILESNLQAATAPYTVEDKIMYRKIQEFFKESGKCSWEGVEVKEYKEFLAKNNNGTH